jgi:hypothetical protein
MHAPVPLDISTMQILANELYTTVANYAKITGDPKLVWIVLEASYLPKETETKKRRDSTHGYYLRAEELFAGDTGSAQDLSAAADSYKLACTVPDCLLRICAEWWIRDGFHVVVPPAEADAQISFMQKTCWVDFVSVPSSDGDIMAYPGTTNILYKPSIKNKKRAGKDHWQLWALLVLRDDIKQDRTVHFTHGADTKGIFCLCPVSVMSA